MCNEECMKINPLRRPSPMVLFALKAALMMSCAQDQEFIVSSGQRRPIKMNPVSLYEVELNQASDATENTEIDSSAGYSKPPSLNEDLIDGVWQSVLLSQRGQGIRRDSVSAIGSTIRVRINRELSLIEVAIRCDFSDGSLLFASASARAHYSGDFLLNVSMPDGFPRPQVEKIHNGRLYNCSIPHEFGLDLGQGNSHYWLFKSSNQIDLIDRYNHTISGFEKIVD